MPDPGECWIGTTRRRSWWWGGGGRHRPGFGLALCAIGAASNRSLEKGFRIPNNQAAFDLLDRKLQSFGTATRADRLDVVIGTDPTRPTKATCR